MSTTEFDSSTASKLITEAVHSADFLRATFGGQTRGGISCPWVRVLLRPVDLRGERYIQFSYFDQKKSFTKNYRGPEIEAPLNELLDYVFAGVHLTTRIEEMDIRITKKGKVLIGRRPTAAVVEEPKEHNRLKDVPLPEGRANRVLEVMGIATATGKVRPTMRAKYTQINEFLKHLIHVLDDSGLRSLGRPLEILDCGCGSSYLTIAAHHYLNDQLGIPARIIGVDVNEEVIRKSTIRADQLGTTGLSFACGTIGTLDTSPDIVFALHACDTATDDAIVQAITTGAKLILSVPCCHQALNKAIRPQGPAAILAPVLRHGILRQRTADLVTDAFRALILRIMGYQTDVVEFVSPEHTARNLMIRAVRGAPVGDRLFVDEYLALRSFWNATPYLEQALGATFLRFVSDR